MTYSPAECKNLIEAGLIMSSMWTLEAVQENESELSAHLFGGVA